MILETYGNKFLREQNPMALNPWNYGKEGQAADLNKSLKNSDPIREVSLTLGKFKRLEVSKRWN